MITCNGRNLWIELQLNWNLCSVKMWHLSIEIHEESKTVEVFKCELNIRGFKDEARCNISQFYISSLSQKIN